MTLLSARLTDGSVCCWMRAARPSPDSSPTTAMAPRRSKPAACPPPPMKTASPALDEQLYARMTDAGYGEEQTAAVSEEEVAAAEAYVRWENESLPGWANCAPMCALSRARSPAARWYPSIWTTTPCAPWTRRGCSCTPARWRPSPPRSSSTPSSRCCWLCGCSATPAAAISCPAMWGLLTLIGNVVAWLVYMLVRSRGVGSRCPRCGTALRMGFAYCPACGAQVRRSCPACGHAAEDGWKVCPIAAGNCPNGRRRAGAP